MRVSIAYSSTNTPNQMTTISPSIASVETSLVAAGSSLDPSLTPSNLVSARDSLATNMEQMDLRKSIIDDSKKWKGLYYAPTSFQKLSADLESERRTLERKVMDDMSHLTEAYNYNIASIQSISAKIPKYPKDVPRQLVEYLSQQSDVPTFDTAVRETGLGGAFVELNYVLERVKFDQVSTTDQGTKGGEVQEWEGGSIAIASDKGAKSFTDSVPYRPRRVSDCVDGADYLQDPGAFDNYEQ